jgi:ribosomal protein S18 acetylase RimI-like enzyme
VAGAFCIRKYKLIMSEKLEIRRATVDQIDNVRELTLKAYAKWVEVTPRKPRPMTADYNEAFEKHRFECLYCNDILVGVVETTTQDDELMVVNVAVDPAYQGLGYGVRLMRHAEGMAREAKLTGTRLYTNKLMRENIALYERLGYRFEKETFHDHGTVAVHMTRPLSGDT